ncbi:MAG: glycogen-binding domain-containing protein [Victivallales bacterium]
MSTKKTGSQKKKKVKFVVASETGKTVSVAGTFNNWDTAHKILVDKNGEGIYQGTMLLAPGTYEYKFYINETWCIDPANPNFSPNEMGTLNSLLVVED